MRPSQKSQNILTLHTSSSEESESSSEESSEEDDSSFLAAACLEMTDKTLMTL